MITIRITNHQAGFAYLTEGLQQSGRRVRVPAYQASISSTQSDNNYHFAVTRDSSAFVFGEVNDQFGPSGECLPSGSEPYLGAIHETERFPFAVRLYRPWCARTISVEGAGHSVRTGILIRQGPARSEGCFTVAGGARAYQVFKRSVLKLVQAETVPANPIFQIYVEAI